MKNNSKRTINMVLNVKKLSSLFLVLILMLLVVATTSTESFAFSTFNKKSPFSGVAYSTYKHNKDKFDGYTIKHGIDISAWQDGPKCDYKKAKKAGVEFAIIKVAGSGYTNGKFYEDSYWTDHFKKARDNGIETGIYFFSQAKTTKEAKKEANYICDKFEKGIEDMYGSTSAKKYLDLPVYMDYEYAGGSAGRLYGISKTTATKCAKKFCETVKSRGYKPGIYANLSFLKGTIDGATLGESYDIWAAQYYNKCEFTGSYTKWQYSSAAKINGLVGSSGKQCNIDVNFWYVKNNDSEKEEDEEETNPKAPEEPEKEKPVITPTTLKSLKGGKQKFTATWTKQKKSKVDGYQVQYSRYSDMSWDLKEKVKSYKTTSKTFKTNFRKEKYYVRIRTYKKIDGTTYYSKWSAKKTVKVK